MDSSVCIRFTGDRVLELLLKRQILFCDYDFTNCLVYHVRPWTDALSVVAARAVKIARLLLLLVFAEEKMICGRSYLQFWRKENYVPFSLNIFNSIRLQADGPFYLPSTLVSYAVAQCAQVPFVSLERERQILESEEVLARQVLHAIQYVYVACDDGFF